MAILILCFSTFENLFCIIYISYLSFLNTRKRFSCVYRAFLSHIECLSSATRFLTRHLTRDYLVNNKLNSRVKPFCTSFRIYLPTYLLFNGKAENQYISFLTFSLITQNNVHIYDISNLYDIHCNMCFCYHI